MQVENETIEIDNPNNLSFEAQCDAVFKISVSAAIF